jgi:hypothetical protein
MTPYRTIPARLAAPDRPMVRQYNDAVPNRPSWYDAP